jgi:hypothetical protein
MEKSLSKKQKKPAEPELQKEFEEIEHTPEKHQEECCEDVDALVKEIEEKEEEPSREEEEREEEE